MTINESIIAQKKGDCNKKAPLCKGGSAVGGGGLSIPPTSLALGHLPLHQGGFFIGKRYAIYIETENPDSVKMWKILIFIYCRYIIPLGNLLDNRAFGEVNEMNNRIKYLDVAKFIGIFCIYLGHFGNSAGKAYPFVFAFHVPLFFFLSGFSETLSADVPFDKYIIKNIKSLLIPCWLFALASLLVVTIAQNASSSIVPSLIDLLKGCIRNHYLAGSLWFLTCLFVIKIAFYVLRKIVKFKWLNLLICAAAYCVSQLLFDPKPTVDPHMVYNIDSACYFIIFYALGYYGAGFIQSLLDWQKPIKKAICMGTGAVLFVYAALLFFGKDLFAYIPPNTVTNLVIPVLRPVCIILFVLIVSRVLENIAFFGSIGKNTLFLCGSEHIVRLCVPLCLQIVGLNIACPNPLATYIYAFALLVLCNKTLVPLEKSAFKQLHLLK